jgi:hypothetical protein
MEAETQAAIPMYTLSEEGERILKFGTVVAVPSLSRFVELERVGWEEELRNKPSYVAIADTESLFTVSEGHFQDDVVSGTCRERCGGLHVMDGQ